MAQTSGIPAALVYFIAALSVVTGQQIGTEIPEIHPDLPTQFCTRKDGCVVRKTKVVADVMFRPMHVKGNVSMPCTAAFGTALCPDAATCTRNCVLEGVDYDTLGVATKGNALKLNQYRFDGTEYKKVAPRVYLLGEDARNYELMRLVNMELAFDVDVSQLGCGMNGALYFSEMDVSGSRSDLNPAGATYGTGECDAQCFQDQNFTNGVANLEHPPPGACCNEMDIWEANRMATALTPHTCSKPSSFRCTGEECGKGKAGVCDKSGCQINPYKLGDKKFYGPGGTIDTNKRFTVLTQFVHEHPEAGIDIARAGPLKEIRRKYIQEGRVIEDIHTSNASISPLTGMDQSFCDKYGSEAYTRLGGMVGTGQSMARGMVLIFSIWNSEGDFMKWLDAGDRGPCGPTDGDPKKIKKETPNVSVTYSNIKWGELGTVLNHDASPGAKGDETKARLAANSAGAMAPTVTGGSVLGLAIVLLALVYLF
ncbi:hypothetical protein PspLS_06053 [Pyricularia sp. CBS 133598]|nr:hypothetical protein PspLS_06053 [Pyricularia sp. CBS 133598]